MPFAKAGAPWAPASSPRSSPETEREMARKGKGDRIVIHLACTDCRERTYTSQKNRRNDSDRLELRKFCPRCRAHKAHRETR